MPQDRRRRTSIASFTTVIVVAITLSSRVAAYTPESPEVKAAVDRAVTFLSTAKDQQLGAKALAARVMIYTGKRDHEVVADALEGVRREIAGAGNAETRIYSVGLALAMLTELDAEQYRPEILSLAAMLVKLQKPHGGWGYPNRETGDTSMTQYAVYGLWNAERAGVTIDRAVWSRVVDWLLKTQDRSGGWGYQGVVPPRSELIDQKEVRRSMCEAALASLYLTGERFGLWEFAKPPPRISAAMKPVVDAPPAPIDTPFNERRFRGAIDAGQHWNNLTAQPIYSQFPCYHLYTIERFSTFRDAALQRDEPAAWYDLGVDLLLKAQKPDGSWVTNEGPVASTGFAALFLLRTTRAAVRPVERTGAGTLVGGRGLPLGPIDAGPTTSPDSAATPKNGFAALARRLEDPAFLSAISAAESVEASPEVPPPTELRKRLIALAMSDSPREQAAALTALARTGNFDHVPLLIESLRDARPEVHQAAVDALRFLSRRTEDHGRPLPPDEPARFAEASRWSEWYRTVRPPAK